MAQKKIGIISFFFVWCIIINYVNAADLPVTVGGGGAYSFDPYKLTALVGDNINFKKGGASQATLIRLAEADTEDVCVRTKRADAFFGELPDLTTTLTFKPTKAGTYFIFDLLNTGCSFWTRFVLTVDNPPANAPPPPATSTTPAPPPAQPTSQPPATSATPAPPPASPTSQPPASKSSESPANKSPTSSVSQTPGTTSSSNASQSNQTSTSSSNDPPKPLSAELIVGIVGSVTGGIFAVIAALITVKCKGRRRENNVDTLRDMRNMKHV